MTWLDPQTREEMAFCNAHGIPHSVFLDWDPDDQDKALGYEREKDKQCSGCYTRKEDWDRDRFAYVADGWTCPGCELLAQFRETISADRQGVKTFLVPRPIYEARQAEKEAQRAIRESQGSELQEATHA